MSLVTMVTAPEVRISLLVIIIDDAFSFRLSHLKNNRKLLKKAERKMMMIRRWLKKQLKRREIFGTNKTPI